jgi:hypothetical protein
LPHVWLEEGAAMQDRIPDGYTVLRLGGTKTDAGGLAAALRARGAPTSVLDVADKTAREIYACDLLLVRPDLHVVWRGNAAPEDCASIAAIATGH